MVVGHGQIGSRVTADLLARGVETVVVTRSARAAMPEGAHHVIGDAARRADIASAAAGAEVIFACFHTRYDSRAWASELPRMEQAVLEAAAESGAVVVFPESTYAFAGDAEVLKEDSAYAPVEDKGRVRRELLEARAAHSARVISILAGDLIGADAEPSSSVVRLLITERVAAGRRAIIPADPDVAHAVTEIADLSRAMIAAGADAQELLGKSPHRLLIAPSQAPTLRQVAEHAADVVGRAHRAPVVLPHVVLRATGLISRTILELARLRPIWRRPCTLVPSEELLVRAPVTPWREGVQDMMEDAARRQAHEVIVGS
ncbi:NAD-dependent epimerase/dehydratase family protein [Nesterenkonia xinjiangensis]